jgi:hypothetical protein
MVGNLLGVETIFKLITLLRRHDGPAKTRYCAGGADDATWKAVVIPLWALECQV